MAVPKVPAMGPASLSRRTAPEVACFELPVPADLLIFPVVVDSPEKLAAFLPTLASAQWVAVDTEADSLHAYPEKVCLIQVSTAAGDRLVDPLAPLALEQFLVELSRHRLIMHGADYDLRLLRKHHDFVPRDIFDTMLAARLLGVRHFSLSDLVEQFLGVKLEKGSQKANWAMRPLTERMEKYARNDTHYLKPLSDRLAHELETRGRLGWHQEYCHWLIRESSRPKEENQDEVWRLKGCHQLERAGLAVLRELWKWREHEALAANRPPFFILSHESLVRLAAAAASGRPVEPLLPRHLSERRRNALLRAAARGCSVPPEQQPRQLRFAGRRPSEGEKRRHQELQRRRDAHAAQLGIDPTLIASRAMISSLAHDWDKHAAELMDWQRRLLSDGAQPATTGTSLAKAG